MNITLTILNLEFFLWEFEKHKVTLEWKFEFGGNILHICAFILLKELKKRVSDKIKSYALCCFVVVGEFIGHTGCGDYRTIMRKHYK